MSSATSCLTFAVHSRTLATLLAAAGLAGCATTDPIGDFRPYLGDDVGEVTAAFGMPTRVVDMQDDTWQYQWVERKARSSTGLSIGGVGLTENAPRECTRIVITDVEKRVIGFDYRGEC